MEQPGRATASFGGSGLAAEFTEFVEPLLDEDGSNLDDAVNLGMTLWNLAVASEDERDAELRAMLDQVPDEEDAAELRQLVLGMIDRHQAMFPELHGGAAVGPELTSVLALETRGEVTEVERVIRRLVCGVSSPEAAERDLEALGEDAVPALIAVMEDERLSRLSAPGRGSAPMHAAELLGDLRATEALEPMLRLLLELDPAHPLCRAIGMALPRLGAPVVEPVLRACAEHDDVDARTRLVGVLADAGVRDERILEILLEHVRREPFQAGHLAAYGDPRAVPHLSQILDDFALDEVAPERAYEIVFELACTIEELGGTLSPEQREKQRAARSRVLEMGGAQWDELPLPYSEPVRRPERPGRNAPCWCGSGKKYKKCHLAADEAALRT